MDLAVTVTNAGRVIEIFERQMAVASTILEFKIPPQTTPRFGFQARIPGSDWTKLGKGSSFTPYSSPQAETLQNPGLV